jgi:hypothetical protein
MNRSIRKAIVQSHHVRNDDTRFGARNARAMKKATDEYYRQAEAARKKESRGQASFKRWIKTIPQPKFPSPRRYYAIGYDRGYVAAEKKYKARIAQLEHRLGIGKGDWGPDSA